MVWIDLAAGDFFHLNGLDPFVSDSIKMMKGLFCQRVGIGSR